MKAPATSGAAGPPSLARPATAPARSTADGGGPTQGSGTLPLVSVVIPSFNHAHFLPAAIESACMQAYRPVEIILVDDGSTDDTAAVAAAFPAVRYIRQENRGLAAARNTGLAHCRGELVVFLDADDRLLPGALETGARLLRDSPALGFVAGHSRFITRDGVPLPTQQPVRSDEDPYTALLRRNTIRNPAMVMFRRNVLEESGGFDSRVDACADYDMYLRISRTHPVRFHSALVAEYRKHGENMSSDAALMIRQLWLVMRAQRTHLASREQRDAFRAGRRNMRQYYGDRLAEQIRERLRSRSGPGRTAGDLATLIRYHPLGAIEHGRRKLLNWWRGGEPTTESA